MLIPLTDRQKQIYDFLAVSVRENGYAPSIPEIGSKFKITSTRGVFDHLKALEKKGYIKRVGKRAIEIISQSGRSALPEAKDIPIVGRVRAGVPVLAEENIEGYLPVATSLPAAKKPSPSRSKATA